MVLFNAFYLLNRLNSSGGSDSLTDSKGTNWIREQCKKVGKVFVEDAVDVVEQALDNKPESIVALEGDEVVAFLEALVNFRSLLPTGGPLVNVPPTLIAPVAFTFGTAERLKVRLLFWGSSSRYSAGFYPVTG